MKISRDGWLLIGLFIVMSVIFALLVGPTPQPESDLSTTYSASASGVKAFYTLLSDRLGYNVERLEAPYTDMPNEAVALVVVGPLKAYPITAEERNALEHWIRAGGTAIFISDSLENIPARFGSTRNLGNGNVYVFNSRSVITNKGLRNYRNAVKIAGIISEHAGVKGLVLFDEYHHGLGRSKTETLFSHTQRQVKLGAAILVLALLVLCYGRGRRFGAVRNLPSSENLRPEFEFVESVARLYDRAGATDLAADILVKSMRQKLCLKLGLASDVPDEIIVRWLETDGKEDAARKVERLLKEAGQKLSKSELVNVAREIHSVEKEFEVGTIIA